MENQNFRQFKSSTFLKRRHSCFVSNPTNSATYGPQNGQQKWQNRGNDSNRDSRFSDTSSNDRFNKELSDDNSQGNELSRPKSLVEQLKTMKKKPRSKSQENNTNESIDNCAKNASKKLLSQLKTMDKDNVKELINNPKQPHRKAVLNIQAREKLREDMRKQLNKLGAEDDQEASLDAVESVNYENIPETLIAQIGRTVDMDLNVEDMDLQPEMDEEVVEDKDIEVVKKNLGNDFLFGSELLLMNGFNLLGESENESEMKITEERFFPPPLPAEPIIARPPEPVPPPSEITPNNISTWPIPRPTQRFDNDWEIDAARNPDPPHLKNISNTPISNDKVQTIPVIVSNPPPQIVPQPSNIINNDSSSLSQKNENPLLISLSESISVTTTNLRTPTVDDKLNKAPSSTSQDSFKTPSIPEPITSTPVSFDGTRTPSVSEDFTKTPIVNDDNGKTPINNEDSSTPNDSRKTAEQQAEIKSEETPKTERRANETYGEYRRRLGGLSAADEENKPKDDFNKPRPLQPTQRKQNSNREDESPHQHNEKGSWMSNNMRNNNFNNDRNNRKSRFEMNRSRDRQNNSNNFNNSNNINNNNKKRNNSRDRNISIWENRDRDSSKDMRDAFNYRFDSGNHNSQDGNGIERLNTLLNPKPVQFKGSFNKRSGYSNQNINNRDSNRSKSRERTPASNSVEREFGETSFSSVNDVRPCYHTLKKITEIENEIARIHEKIHTIDKVITNLQTERIGYQKTFTNLQHDKKILFDSLIKRVMQQNENIEENHSKDREKDRLNEQVVVKKDKDLSNKKTTCVPEQRKRKVEESSTTVTSTEDDCRKKKKYSLEEEPKSSAQKAKEREEEERRKRIEEIRRQKQLRREREEAERRRLEDEAKKESNETIPVINRDKPKENDKEKRNHKDHGPISSTHSLTKCKKPGSKPTRNVIKWADVIDSSDIKIKMFSIEFEKMTFNENILDQYKSERYPELEVDQLMAMKMLGFQSLPAKDIEKLDKVKQEKELDDKNDDIESDTIDPLQKEIENDKDPVSMDDSKEIANPPTPGSNLALIENDDTNAPDQTTNNQDYSEWTGNFESHDQPIVHIQNINGKQMACAAEDGKLYKYNLVSGECEATFTKHTAICNSFLYDDRDQSIYTASSDGYVHRIKFKAFDSIGCKQLSEPLQVIEKSKNSLYVGAKSGNIYKLKMDFSDEEVEPLCLVGSLILCMRCTKEGSRNILLVSSRSNAIQVRDANDGLLLRTLSNDLSGVNIYDMLLEGSTIYCGNNSHDIFALDFTTGALMKKHSMNGAGAINVRIYKHNLIVACYDGNIYVFDLNTGEDAVNVTGPSNMLLAMDLWDDKIIASTKDKTLKIMSIPT